MAIEYIGGITLKAPQHIEDKLAALIEECDDDTKWRVLFENCNAVLYRHDNLASYVAIGAGFNRDREADAFPVIAALHNAAPALLAVVRAARALNEETDAAQRAYHALCLSAALHDLDAVEV